MNLDCSVVSCVLQLQNQTKVNINFSLPAGAAAVRAGAAGHRAAPAPGTGTPTLRCRPCRWARGCPRGYPPPRLPSTAVTQHRCREPRTGAGGAAGTGVPEPPLPPQLPEAPAARPRRRSGSLRRGLLLSFGALVCFLKRCSRASIFPRPLGRRSHIPGAVAGARSPVRHDPGLRGVTAA